MALPPIYLDASLRNVTPICPDRQRIGLGVDMVGGTPVRLALALIDAQSLADLLVVYINSFAGTHSPMSALISSSSISVPSDGENV